MSWLDERRPAPPPTAEEWQAALEYAEQHGAQR